MQTDDLERILSKAEPELFKGVFPRDALAQFNQLEGIYIFNTDPISKPGSHWIGVVALPDNNSIEYFDSYGLPPILWKGIYKALTTGARILKWNNVRLQGVLSTVCGDYSLMFLLMRARGISMEKFISWLKSFPNAEDRDHYIRQLVLHCFNDIFTPTIGEGKDRVHIYGSDILI